MDIHRCELHGKVYDPANGVARNVIVSIDVVDIPLAMISLGFRESSVGIFVVHQIEILKVFRFCGSALDKAQVCLKCAGIITVTIRRANLIKVYRYTVDSGNTLSALAQGYDIDRICPGISALNLIFHDNWCIRMIFITIEFELEYAALRKRNGHTSGCAFHRARHVRDHRCYGRIIVRSLTSQIQFKERIGQRFISLLGFSCGIIFVQPLGKTKCGKHGATAITVFRTVVQYILMVDRINCVGKALFNLPIQAHCSIHNGTGNISVRMVPEDIPEVRIDVAAVATDTVFHKNIYVVLLDIGIHSCQELTGQMIIRFVHQ